MSTNAKAVEARGRFLERIEGGAAEASIDDRLVALTNPMGAAAEQYRMLLHRLRYMRSLRAGNIQGGAVIAVTSSVRGEGVSITAANLALTAARARDAVHPGVDERVGDIHENAGHVGAPARQGLRVHREVIDDLQASGTVTGRAGDDRPHLRSRHSGYPRDDSGHGAVESPIAGATHTSRIAVKPA